MPADTWTLLRAWQFAPGAGIPLAVLAAAYLAGVLRAARRRPGGRPPRRPGVLPPGRAWPRGRTAAFLAGLAVAAAATQGPAAVYDEVSLPAHMAQHLLLIMVVPPLLVFGRPVTLALHVTRNPWHTRIKRALRSRAVTALTWPGTGVVLYSAVVAGTHLTGLLTARGAAHDAEHAAYLAAGYLFFLPVIGSEPLRWRVSALGRYLLLLAAMPADAVTGAVLMLRGGTGGYSAPDTHAGGLVMLAGGQLVMAGLALVLAVAVVRETEVRETEPRETEPAVADQTLTAGDPGHGCVQGKQRHREEHRRGRPGTARHRACLGRLSRGGEHDLGGTARLAADRGLWRGRVR